MYTLTDLKGFSLDLKLSVGIWCFAPGGGRLYDCCAPRKRGLPG